MTVGLHPHGAARAAVEDVDGLSPPAFSPAVSEQLARAEVDEAEAHLAWELCRGLPLDPADHRALQTLLLLVLDGQARGSTRVSLDPEALGARAASLGADAEAVRSILPRLADAPFNQLIGPPAGGRPLVREPAHLYTARLHSLECELAARIAARINVEAAMADQLDAALAALDEAPTFARETAISLTAEQRAGVRTALAASLAVISGGPGTGKTSIVVAILRAAMRAGRVETPSGIALAAPTGKAADRMRRALTGSLASIRSPSVEDERLLEALPTPKTLHRLLGWSPSRGRFRHHADNPLAADLVVVDESSMVDVFMMAQLMRSLRPGTGLVLLGDAEQLPSVAAGAVFRDLASASQVDAQVAHVAAVHLTESHRMNPEEPAGFNVLSVATRINAGRRLALTELDSAHPGRPRDLDAVARLPEIPTSLDGLEGVSLLEPTPAGREAFLDRWLAERVDPASIRPLSRRTWRRSEGRIADDEQASLEALFNHLERARLLTVTRGAGRTTGAEAINQSLHQRMTAGRRAGPGWVAGEPTLVHRNDYDRGLFNGDQGVVLWTEEAEAPGARLHVVFRREPGFVTFPLESVRPTLSLGYATTVHKAQGSEHEQVAVMLPEHDSRLLTREILYTAVTRARRSVLIVGDKALLDRAVSRTIERSSGIADRIASAVGRER